MFLPRSRTLSIEDQITGSGKHAIEVVYPLHPGVAIACLSENIAVLEAAGRELRVEVHGPGKLALEPSKYHRAFGDSVANGRLVYRTTIELPVEIATKIEW